MLEAFRNLEIIMERKEKVWHWSICLPGLPYIAKGTGLDQEDCWQKATRAKNYLQRYGMDSMPYGT